MTTIVNKKRSQSKKCGVEKNKTKKVSKNEYKYLKFNKLIRDKNPQTIERSGGYCAYSILQHDKYISLLREKLVEEANEVLQAKNIDEITDELGDVLDVIKVMIKSMKIKRRKIWKCQRKKAKARGKLKKGIFCYYVKFPKDVNEKWMDKYKIITERMAKELVKKGGDSLIR